MGKVSASVLAKVKKWLGARQDAARADGVKKSLEAFVRQAVSDAPGKSIEIGTQTVSLIPVSGGKHLKLQAAEKALGKKTLEPFWKEIPATRSFDETAAAAFLGKLLDPFYEELPGSERLIVK